MKPAYWIGIMGLVGAIVGYLISRWTGWLGSIEGAIIGIIIGTLLYAIQMRKLK